MKTKLEQAPSSTAGNDPGVDPVINTVGLTKTFGHVNALQGIDLVVPDRSIVGFLGPNGSGKTTAIKLLLGLSRPTSGVATLFGMDSVQNSLEIRSRVGYLAQDPRFYTHLTARETLEFAARFFYRGPKQAIRDRIDETLELVGLADKADRPTKGFSGGERQRLGIAQAQINYPDLLILDEPAAALDPIGRRDVLDVMERLRAYTTIFYSTHILDDVQRVSDYVAILDRGRLIASAPTTDLLNSEATTFRLTIKGDEQAALQTVRSHSWVSGVSSVSRNGSHELTVDVSDMEAAESELLASLVGHQGLVVISFVRKQFNLEDVFLGMVKGSSE